MPTKDEGTPVNLTKDRPVYVDLPSGERLTLVRQTRKDGHEVLRMKWPKGTRLKRGPKNDDGLKQDA